MSQERSRQDPGGAGPTREDLFREIEETLGAVPSFLKAMPDEALSAEWAMYKGARAAAGPIPAKYRELIGLAVAAATRCPHTAFYHEEAARLHGATEEEIRDAVRYAAISGGWSVYLHGSRIGLEEFKREVIAMARRLRASRSGEAA